MIGAISPLRIVDGRAVPVAGTWEFDSGHTEVAFEGRHLMVSTIRGSFRRFSGRIHVADKPEESRAELTIEAASVESGFKDRDDHLRSADWFDVARYPTIHFQSNGIRHVSGKRWRASGNLTIREVGRRVEIDIEFGGATIDPWGHQKIGGIVRATVNRQDFGLNWNMPLKAGGILVGNEIRLIVSGEAVCRASEQPGEATPEQLDAGTVAVRG